MNQEEFKVVIRKIHNVVGEVVDSSWDQECLVEEIEMLLRDGFHLPENDDWSW